MTFNDRRPPATIALIGAATLAFVAMNFIDRAAVMHWLLISNYTQPLLPEIRSGQWWRLITPIFLHFGIFHMVFNMLWTWELGRLIEARQGALALLGMTALIGIGSNLMQYDASGPGFGGMSGVVYGYFGYLWIQGLFNPRFGIRLIPPVVYLMLGWFVLGWTGILGIFGIRIANLAHSGGLVGGIALAFVVIAISRLRHTR